VTLKKWLFLLLISIAATNQAMAKRLNVSQESECIPVRPEHPVKQSFRIVSPGRYCVVEDFDQSWVLSLPHTDMPFPSMAAIAFNAKDVELDLQGHTIRIGRSLYNHVAVFGGARTVIKNGTIEAIDGLPVYGVGLEEYLRPWEPGFSYDKLIEQGRVKWLQAFYLEFTLSRGDMDNYPTRELVLENLTIRARHNAIVLQGKNNVIRNCRIEGGNETLLLYGPNPQIINNKIVLNGKDFEVPEMKNMGHVQRKLLSVGKLENYPVALWLEDADNAVVSGNTIVVKGSAKDAQAIALTNSRNVHIENNTIRGVEHSYQLRDVQSSISLESNNGNISPADEAKRSAAIRAAAVLRDAQAQAERRRIEEASRPSPAEAYTLALLKAIRARDRAAFDSLLAQPGDVSRAAVTVIERGQTPFLAVLDDKSTFSWAPVLLARGVDVNYANQSGVTALMLTAVEGDTALMTTLLKQGAKVDAQNVNGSTPLVYAAGAGQRAAVEMLLRAHADPNLRNKAGTTALTAARLQGFDEIVKVIEQAGGKP
jgi:hypothetical protein